MVSRFFFHLEIYRSSFIHADNRRQFKRKHIGEGKKVQAQISFLSRSLSRVFLWTDRGHSIYIFPLLELKYENEQRASWRQHLFNVNKDIAII